MKEVCIVTGASSGLGRELSIQLCEKGKKVYAVARSKDKLLALKKECENFSGELVPLTGDLTDSKVREKLIQKVISIDGKIDFLINNAGFGKAVLFEEQDYETLNQMFQLNVLAYQHLSALTLKQMKKQKSGRLIHIASVVPFTPLPYFTTYNSTKAAIYTFNRSLRYELKNSKITSTVVLPARMSSGFANNAFKKEDSAKKFNDFGESPKKIAKKIIKKINSGKEVITPGFRSKLWYFMRFFGKPVDFAMKNFLGPKQLEDLNSRQNI